METNLITDMVFSTLLQPTSTVAGATGSAIAGAASHVLVHTINWTIIGGIATALIPIIIAVITIVLRLNSEKGRIAESALRESPVIQDLHNANEKTAAELANRINEQISFLTNNIKEANAARETIRSDANRLIEQQRQSLDEIRTIVFTMRSDLEILRNENQHQDRSIEELRADNRELVTRLEGLIKELYEYLNSTN